jgi:fructokinase
MTKTIQIGVDFGGTKIEAAALDASGAFLARIRAPNPGSYDAALQAIVRLIEEIEAATGGKGTIGIGTPGSISPRSGVMRNANSVWLNGRNLRDDLSAELKRPVRIANDANCLALSEVVDGAAAGSAVTFAVVLGTGCGGGLVVNGELVEGANGIGGEWGHIPLPDPKGEHESPLCWCGKRGCLEMWISGSGLARDYQVTRGISQSCEEVISLMREADAFAGAVFHRYLDRLGRALAVVCNIIDPDTIVFGGGLSNVPELYAALPVLIGSHVFSDSWTARLVPARWGDSSGVRGAARLWPGQG